MPGYDPAAPGGCTCNALRRAAGHVTQLYDQALSPVGLRITQYSLLSRLARSGPRSIQALARELGLDRTTIGRNLQPLEREGLVALRTDSADRRSRVMHVTDLGADRLREAESLWKATETRFAEAYGVERSRQLHAVLRELSSIQLA